MRVLTAAQMRSVDRRTIEDFGVPGVVLMENAGRGAADILCAEYASLKPGPVLILCGKGNNGGDGYVVARYLCNRGWQVDTLVLAEPRQVAGDAGINLRALQSLGTSIEFAADEASLTSCLEGCRPAIVVDALFGTGLNSELRGTAVAAVSWINSFQGPVLAIDIPSGVDASSGRELGCGVNANLTATFAAPKVGHLVHPGCQLSGKLRVIDIGVPPKLLEETSPSCTWLSAAEAAGLLPERPPVGHKGTFGHQLLIAGARGKIGAAVLAAAAGLRSGAGLVSLAVPSSQQAVVATARPEAMTEGLPDEDGSLGPVSGELLAGLCEGKQSLAVGPGLGQAAPVADLVHYVLTGYDGALVLDADALNVLASQPEILLRRRGRPLVLTPHPGEMARLCHCKVADIESDRIGVARDFARRFDLVLVLKGAPTLIASPDGRLTINSSGNPLLATGGSGDVLTGLLGGLLAQGMAPFEAACLGVYLHGAAADRLLPRLGDAGLLAGDLAAEIPAARLALKGGPTC